MRNYNNISPNKAFRLHKEGRDHWEEAEIEIFNQTLKGARIFKEMESRVPFKHPGGNFPDLLRRAGLPELKFAGAYSFLGILYALNIFKFKTRYNFSEFSNLHREAIILITGWGER